MFAINTSLLHLFFVFIFRKYGKVRRPISNHFQQIVLAVIFAFVVILPCVEGSSCTRRITTQLLAYKDCFPKRVFIHSCVGSCITHAQVSPTNPLVLEHTCYQCKEAVIKKRRVKMKCPDPGSPKRIKNVVIEVPVPQECMCQSCSFEDTVNISKEVDYVET